MKTKEKEIDPLIKTILAVSRGELPETPVSFPGLGGELNSALNAMVEYLRSEREEFRELEEQSLDSYCLNYACRLISSALDLAEIDRISLEAFVDIGNADRGSLMLKDIRTGAWKVALIRDGDRFIQDDSKVINKGGIPALVAEDGKLKIFNDLKSKEYVALYRPVGDELKRGATAYLCLPLKEKQYTIGVVNLYKDGGEAVFSQSEVNALAILASYVSSSICTAHFYELAIYDSLTRLHMRSYFEVRLDEEVLRIRNRGGELSLIMFDLDNFKKINDTYGHPAGDRVLKHVARIIMDELRKGIDLPARYGGEEFIVMLPGTPLEAALKVAQRINRMVARRPFRLDSETILITVSAGVSSFRQAPRMTPGKLILRADSALYQAKNKGRNRVC
ncbi:MAG TPA: GGDEF domain-containing protein [Proteobacteria bacterium]|nr:GGDEF domain-containing protein [Pseudomonadota bacterium]